MKSLLIILLSLATLTVKAGGGEKYEKVMAASIQEMFTNNDMAKYDALANKFSRIGDAEADQWMPYYYASLTYVFKSFRQQEDLKALDATLDNAHTSLDKAKALSKDNSEIVALTGFINMMKIQVDPGTRGQTLAPGIVADFAKAMQLDPNNPRAVLFMGQMNFGTAQFFGKGLDEACAIVEKSITMFESEKPDAGIAPSWGDVSAYQYRKMCEEAQNTSTENTAE